MEKLSKFEVSAYSEDGIIEAVELKDRLFVMGLQWHPESIYDHDNNSKKIFSNFIDNCKKNMDILL